MRAAEGTKPAPPARTLALFARFRGRPSPLGLYPPVMVRAQIRLLSHSCPRRRRRCPATREKYSAPCGSWARWGAVEPGSRLFGLFRRLSRPPPCFSSRPGCINPSLSGRHRAARAPAPIVPRAVRSIERDSIVVAGCFISRQRGRLSSTGFLPSTSSWSFSRYSGLGFFFGPVGLSARFLYFGRDRSRKVLRGCIVVAEGSEGWMHIDCRGCLRVSCG